MTSSSLSLRRACAIATAAVACAGLAACGSSGGGSSSSAEKTATTAPSGGGGGGGGEQLTLAASEKGGLSFTKSSLKAKAGSVTITMDNPSGDTLPHAIAVEGNGVDKDGSFAQPGSKSSVTVDLKPGKYQFYCPVGNHRAQGMEGTLTVQ